MDIELKIKTLEENIETLKIKLESSEAVKLKEIFLCLKLTYILIKK